MSLPVPPAAHLAVIREAKDALGLVPSNLRAGLARYLDLGMEPGGFLCAVIDNDLNEAVCRCHDPMGDGDGLLVTLKPLALWLYTYAPPGCWGSKAKRLAWQERVSELVRAEFEQAEAHDTERPPAPSFELPDLEAPGA